MAPQRQKIDRSMQCSPPRPYPSGSPTSTSPCPQITAALQKRLQHPVLGYLQASDAYWNAIIDWNRHRHGFEIDRSELAFCSVVVKGIAYAVNFLTFTSRGDTVVIQPPYILLSALS